MIDSMIGNSFPRNWPAKAKQASCAIWWLRSWICAPLCLGPYHLVIGTQGFVGEGKAHIFVPHWSSKSYDTPFLQWNFTVLFSTEVVISSQKESLADLVGAMWWGKWVCRWMQCSFSCSPSAAPYRSKTTIFLQLLVTILRNFAQSD